MGKHSTYVWLFPPPLLIRIIQRCTCLHRWAPSPLLPRITDAFSPHPCAYAHSATRHTAGGPMFRDLNCQGWNLQSLSGPAGVSTTKREAAGDRRVPKARVPIAPCFQGLYDRGGPRCGLGRAAQSGLLITDKRSRR